MVDMDEMIVVPTSRPAKFLPNRCPPLKAGSCRDVAALRAKQLPARAPAAAGEETQLPKAERVAMEEVKRGLVY